MKTLADIKREIECGTELIREDEYLGRDGIPYCKNCNTARIHIMPDRIHAIRGMCECQYAALRAARDKERQEQMLIDYNKRKRLSEIIGANQDVTFKDFIKTDRNKAAFEKCVNYLNNSQEMKSEGVGMYISGASSTGKSFLTTCLCNELLLQGWSCLYTTITELLIQIDDSYRRIGLVNEKVINKMKRFDFIFIDDFGKEFLGREYNPATVKSIERQVLSLLVARCRTQKPTIFTSNYSRNELGGILALDSAIVERINEMSTRSIRLSGENFRDLRKAAKSKVAKQYGV